jgi:protease IV
MIVGCQKPTKVCMQGLITARMPVDNTACPVGQRMVSGSPAACEKIAIIDVDGMLLNRNFKGMESLGENPVSLFHEKLSAASRDPEIRAVMIRINSPGGSVTASDLMRREVMTFKQECHKPTMAVILDVGTGGAYYLATACDSIVAHPTSVVGGIGVILNLYNMSDTMEQQNIEATPVRAGDFTDLGSPVRKLDKKGKELLDQIADEFHKRFQSAVKETRPQTDISSMDGRVFSANVAKANGFVDDVLYLDEAIRQLLSYNGLCSNAKVVMFRRNNDRALTEFDITPNTPTSIASIPFSIPGLDRANLPYFLYLWQPEPGLERHIY